MLLSWSTASNKTELPKELPCKNAFTNWLINMPISYCISIPSHVYRPKIFVFWSVSPLSSCVRVYVRAHAFVPARNNDLNLLLPISFSPNRNCIFSLFVFMYTVIITMPTSLWKTSSVFFCRKEFQSWSGLANTAWTRDIFDALVKIFAAALMEQREWL